MRQRPPTPQRSRCSCNHVVDTPEWHGARSSGAGLTTRGGAAHGNPFAGTDACVHSELKKTTRRVKAKRTYQRVR